MNAPLLPTLEDRLTLHVAELNSEIHECISHIACNDLHAVEESLWRQEMLTSTLLSALPPRPASAPAGQVLQSMANALLRANQSYSELLQQVQLENTRLLQLSCAYSSRAHHPQHMVEV